MTPGIFTRIGSAFMAAVLLGTPAIAEVDLSGNWQVLQHEDWPDRGPGPEPVDYTGLALTPEGRAKALSYTAAQLALSERQCLYYAPQYVVIGPQAIKIWSEHDAVTGRVIAWKISASLIRDIITIWMDGRPHPSKNAFHDFSGFDTGAWEGDMLTAHLTHLKEGYNRRNGVPSSDQAEVTIHLMRHDDLLTVMFVMNDPIYLAEPHVVDRTFVLNPRGAVGPMSTACFPFVELPELDGTGKVPHLLPGTNPDINTQSRMHNLPQDAVLGFPETIYPEYRKKIKDSYVRPEQCTRYCCGWAANGGPESAPGLSCITNGAARFRGSRNSPRCACARCSRTSLFTTGLWSEVLHYRF